MRVDYFELSRRARKLYAQTLEPLCGAHRLSRSELDVLLFLYNNPEYDRAADIVVHRGMVKSQVSMSVTTLEARGFLRRSADPADRRTVHLELTEPAREIARQGREVQQRFFEAMFDGISHEDLMRWQGLIQAVEANLASMDRK